MHTAEPSCGALIDPLIHDGTESTMVLHHRLCAVPCRSGRQPIRRYWSSNRSDVGRPHTTTDQWCRWTQNCGSLWSCWHMKCFARTPESGWMYWSAPKRSLHAYTRNWQHRLGRGGGGGLKGLGLLTWLVLKIAALIWLCVCQAVGPGECFTRASADKPPTKWHHC
jgi:hypothetical protein